MTCPSYVVDLDRPVGERFDGIDAEMIDRAKAILSAVKAEAPPAAVRLAPLFNARTRWRFSREVKAMGRYAGIDWRWLMLANVSYDLALAYMSCSTVALPAREGPVLARNMDWWPEDKLAAASCTIRYVKGGRLRWAIAGWPGSLGVVSGLSARGFAVVINAVLSRQPCSMTGYPVVLFLRTVLEDAGGFGEAVAM
ncbi:MAG: carcinine hydrolase/isopenicillin-N N-acyltransferase family protein, partial [Phycisphaerae bacterium]